LEVSELSPDSVLVVDGVADNVVDEMLEFELMAAL